MLGSGARLVLGTTLLACAAALSGCAHGPEPVALQNKVFYQYDANNASQAKELESAYPSLDKADQPPLPRYVGVSVLGDAVRLSRPRDWVIRAGSMQAEHRYIEYVSPNEYMVTVYELVESPLDPWTGILARYEEEGSKSGADFVGKHIPMATWNAQGRGYVVRRAVPAAKAPLVNYANEYILRSDRRLVLLQIVHHDENIAPLQDELRRVVETFQVN
jgi:hypothetical protein